MHFFHEAGPARSGFHKKRRPAWHRSSRIARRRDARSIDSVPWFPQFNLGGLLVLLALVDVDLRIPVAFDDRADGGRRGIRSGIPLARPRRSRRFFLDVGMRMV